MFDDAVFWLSLGTLIVVLLSLTRNPSATCDNSRLERKVDLILSHLGLDPHEGLDGKIVELVKSGQKIQAIKLYREQTGAGLKDARDYVEGL
jgi:Ribosomal protein L7/L12 C-terminal domain